MTRNGPRTASKPAPTNLSPNKPVAMNSPSDTASSSKAAALTAASSEPVASKSATAHPASSKAVDPSPTMSSANKPSENASTTSYSETETETETLPPLFTPPLRTAGRYIVDASGQRFKLAAVNWYGGSDELFVPGGLDIRPRKAIAHLIRKLGFNTIRLPYSDELVLTNPVPDSSLLAANQDLVGQRALDILVAVAEACTDAGLAVVVNDHITQAGWCDGRNLCDAIWKNDHLGPFFCRVRQTEEQWLSNWCTVMTRLVSNPRVVGVDLRNEPRGIWGTLSWGSWARAAKLAGERLLELNKDWLVIVEGLGSANDCSGARREPISLSVPHRLVYSVHIFAWSGWGSLSPFSKRSYPSFALEMQRNWTWLLEDEIAPVWVGEMGGPDAPTAGDQHYWENLIRYLADKDVDFGYWALNPRKPAGNELERWSLVRDDWETVVEDYRLQSMRTLMRELHSLPDSALDQSQVKEVKT